MKEKQKIYWRVDGRDNQNEIWKSKLQTDAFAIKCHQYLVSRAKPDNNECMKNQRTQFILK